MSIWVECRLCRSKEQLTETFEGPDFYIEGSECSDCLAQIRKAFSKPECSHPVRTKAVACAGPQSTNVVSPPAQGEVMRERGLFVDATVAETVVHKPSVTPSAFAEKFGKDQEARIEAAAAKRNKGGRPSTTGKPWEALGISRAAYYKRQRKGK